MKEESQEVVRLDKWLWAARFFRTRSLATAAVTGGKVHVNGERCKPGRRVHPGDRLRVQRDSQLFEVDIVALAVRRGPAAQAQQLYLETPESLSNREAAIERQRQERSNREPTRRPGKRDRRQIRRFLHPEEET